MVNTSENGVPGLYLSGWYGVDPMKTNRYPFDFDSLSNKPEDVDKALDHLAKLLVEGYLRKKNHSDPAIRAEVSYKKPSLKEPPKESTD